MATENSPPKIRIILTVAFSSVVILIALNSVFKSYFLMMTEDVEHDHLAVPAELNKLHEGEQRNLTTSNLPIAQAMQELAQRGREGSEALKRYADITPEASNDLGPQVGWIRAPNQAVMDAIAAADDDAGAAPATTAQDGGAVSAATSLDGGASKGRGDGGAVRASGGSPHETRDGGAH
jgi:hypothetical protein